MHPQGGSACPLGTGTRRESRLSISKTRIHPLEILQFPLDKGAEKWNQPSDKLFLGVDHTAIVVGDTEASLRFYRDLLGMRIAGESENYGTEQEHLNNVFGAYFRITSLRAPGPASNCLNTFRRVTGVRFHWMSMPTM